MSFKRRAEELYSLLAKTMTESADQVEAVAECLIHKVSQGKTVFTCGNGGSAATAAHLVEELVGKFDQVRPAVPAICLNVDATSMSCIANDFGWRKVFSRQLEALGKYQDVLVGFSTSGDSNNVAEAMRMADSKGVATIYIGGESEGVVGLHADMSIMVPSSVTARIQEVHVLILHYLLERIEERLNVPFRCK